MQIDRSRHLKSREISATSPTRDPKSKLYSRAALLSEESDLVFPFFPPSPVTTFENYPFVRRQRGQTAAMLSFFISVRYRSQHRLPREKRRDGLKRQESERIRRDRGKEFHVVVRVHSLWNFYLCRESHSRKLHSSSFTLCVCVCIPLNK